jgi:hypothetical protein
MRQRELPFSGGSIILVDSEDSRSEGWWTVAGVSPRAGTLLSPLHRVYQIVSIYKIMPSCQ